MERTQFSVKILILLVLAFFTAIVGSFFFFVSGNIFLLFLFYLLLMQVFLGSFICLQDIKSEINLSFAFFCFSFAFWTLSVHMVINRVAGGLIMWDKFIFVWATIVPASLLYFTVVFPEGIIPHIYRRTILLLALCFLALVPTNLIICNVVIIGKQPTPVFGNGYPFFMLYVVFFFSFGVFKLINKYGRAKGIEKLQLRYVLLGLALTLFFATITNLILPAFGNASFFSLGPYFTLFFIGFTAYAIVKHRLMDISVVISRATAEVLAILFHAVIYSALYYFYFTYVSKMLGFPFWLATVAYGIVVAETHHNLRLFIQTTSDKLFLRGKYDYYKELANATSRVGEKLALPEILDVLYGTFSEVVEISSPRIFLPDNFIKGEKASARYVVYGRENHLPLLDGQEIKAESPLVKVLVESRGPVFDGKEIDAALIVPCLLEDRLIAVFALGNKLSEEAYTDDDLRLLKALASQVAVALDHTRSYEKIKVELEVTERQLERSQRLASLGTLTAGVTHEIRNPLTVIRAETERLPSQPRDQEYLKQHQVLVLKHIDRIAGIVQRMLGLAKVKAKRIEDVDLNSLLDSTVELCPLDHISVKKELGEIPPVKGDPEELQEIFVNLIQNAIEAMSGEGTLTLKTYPEEHRVVAEVTDTGKGIPEEIREKIFDPFYSTRHEGVGLGLSIVYRIVRENGGDIKVESEVGKGSTFKVLF